MANGTGNPGVQSRWVDGDLVFETLAGVEVLRIGATGVLSISGVAFPTAVGADGTLLTSDGTNVVFEAPAP